MSLKILSKKTHDNNRKKSVRDSQNTFVVAWFKIIVTHFQLMPLMKKIDFSYDSFSNYFLYVQSYLGNSAEAISSIDCLMIKSRFIENLYKSIYYIENGEQSAIFLKTKIFCFLPFFAVFALANFWIFKKQKIWIAHSYILISSLITIDFLHPSIINSMIDTLACVQFEGRKILKKDYFYECFDEIYMKEVNIFIIY